MYSMEMNRVLNEKLRLKNELIGWAIGLLKVFSQSV
jgi:hypothetical protein